MNQLPRMGRVLVTIGAVVLGGCQEGGIAPMAPTPTIVGSRGTSGGGAVDTVLTEFRVWVPRGGVFVVGGEHMIVFPMAAICDPATSSYGRAEWDQPCAPAAGSVTIRARSWRGADGHPRIEFQPDLRFEPSTSVELVMRDRIAAAASSGYSILSCGADRCYDESLTDPSVTTHRDAKRGILYRRIKHFSNYNIALGFAEDASSLPAGVPAPF